MNGVPLDELLNTDTMTNFGWGRNIEDGKAREGMFYVNPGNGGKCEGFNEGSTYLQFETQPDETHH